MPGPEHAAAQPDLLPQKEEKRERKQWKLFGEEKDEKAAEKERADTTPRDWFTYLEQEKRKLGRPLTDEESIRRLDTFAKLRAEEMNRKLWPDLRASEPVSIVEDERKIAEKEAALRRALDTLKDEELGIAGHDVLFVRVIRTHSLEEEDRRNAAQKELHEQMRAKLGEKFTDKQIDEILADTYERRFEFRLSLASRKFMLAQEAELFGKLDPTRREALLRQRGMTEEDLQGKARTLASLDRVEAEVTRNIQSSEAMDHKESQSNILREQLRNDFFLERSRVNFDHLSEAGLRAVKTFMEREGKDVTLAILSSNFQEKENGLVGTIGGEEVTLSLGNDVRCYLTYGANKIYLDGNMRPAGFNAAVLTKLGKKIDSSFLEDPSQARNRLWELLTKSMASYYMQRPEADWTEQVFRTILPKHLSRQEEMRALTRLGLIHEDGTLNIPLICLWGVELRMLAQELEGTRLDKEVRFEDLVRIADRWKREREPSLMSLADVRRPLQDSQ